MMTGVLAETKDMADIFLSYAREDVARARQIAETLESRGWSVWWDRRIPPGQDFTAYIQRQLDEARCIVVLWSKASVASQFVRDEAAEGLNGRLVPLLLDAVRQPLGFRQLQVADLANWAGDVSHDEFNRLVESIGAIAPRTRAAATTGVVPASPSVRHEQPIVVSDQAQPFSYDAYISFSHLDNVEIIEGQIGWVAKLHRALEIRLSQILGRQSRVYMNPRLAGNELFDEGPGVIQQAAALVAVVSPRYARSGFAVKELREFRKASEAQPDLRLRERARVFKVVKTPVAHETLPEELQSTLGYEFFRIDPVTGKTREFDEVFGPEAQREFWLRLDDLAHDLATFLQELSPER
jgi:hypothetical protein